MEYQREKIELKYKNFPSPLKINTAWQIMNFNSYIPSETIEDSIYTKATQEKSVIEHDILSKMSKDAKDIMKIIMMAPFDFLDVLSKITYIGKRTNFNSVKNLNPNITLKLRFRLWLTRFMKGEYNLTHNDADIKAGKIIREIKKLVH